MEYNVGWRHSNVSEPDFVPPWEASSRALDLSFELAQNPKDNPGDRNKFARASVSVMRLKFSWVTRMTCARALLPFNMLIFAKLNASHRECFSALTLGNMIMTEIATNHTR